MGRIYKYNTANRPPYTIGLMLLIGFVGLADIFTDEMMLRLFAARGLDVQHGQYWRLLTMGFVHGSFAHIGFNLYGLWILGGLFERMAGSKWMLGVFLASVLASSAAGVLYYPLDQIMLGASGGVYGLFAAILAVLYVRIGSFQGMLQVPVAKSLLTWLMIGVVFSVVVPNVSLLGHVAGFVPGAVLGYYFENWYSRKADVYHRAAAIMVVALTLVLSAYACYPLGRASFDAVRAMKSFESGNLDEGDKFLESAIEGSHRDSGTNKLIFHLKLWRNYMYQRQPNYREALTSPLMQADGVGKNKAPYGYIDPQKLGIPLNSIDYERTGGQDTGSKKATDGDQ